MLGRLHNMVLFPAFSRAQSDKGYLANALLLGTEATAALTLPLCAWGLVLGPEIIFVLLGPGWEEAVIPFQILSLGVYFRSGYQFSASIVFATGHVFALSVCQGIYGILIVGGALFGARWGIVGVAIATLLALLVFYLLLYALTARVSGASVWSFIRVHFRPALGFVIVLATAALGRTWLRNLDWSPILVLITTVALGILALSGATHVLKNRLWGDFLYQQGLTALGRHAPATEVENQEHDDLGA
jgi:PST family polysaccharide transporter